MIGYPSGQDGAILPARDYLLYLASKISSKAIYKSFIDQVCSVKMAGYWPRSFFACLWTETQKNLANIQPSWPHTWSITHTGSNSPQGGPGNGYPGLKTVQSSCLGQVDFPVRQATLKCYHFSTGQECRQAVSYVNLTNWTEFFIHLSCYWQWIST